MLSHVRLFRFVNARMRLWKKYIVEEREKVKVEGGKEEKEERDRKRTNQALSTRMTRTQRMSKRAQKRHAEEQERTAKVEGEDESRPSKKRKRQSSNIASTQARTAKVEAVPAPSTPFRLPSSLSALQSTASFAPLFASTMQSIPGFCATLSTSNATSPVQLPRFQASSAAVSSTVPSPSSALLASSTAFRFSSVPLFTLSSQPPPVYHAAAQFDFDMPATFTMSMTLPNTLQLPALTDSVAGEPTQTPQPTLVDAAGGAQYEEEASSNSVSGTGLFSPPLSTQLLNRSLRLTFTATQWASLAQFVPVTPTSELDREMGEAEQQMQAERFRAGWM